MGVRYASILKVKCQKSGKSVECKVPYVVTLLHWTPLFEIIFGKACILELNTHNIHMLQKDSTMCSNHNIYSKFNNYAIEWKSFVVLSTKDEKFHLNILSYLS